MTDKLCGPLAALIFHESLQGRKISHSNPIYNRYKLNNTLLTIVSLIKIQAKAVYMFTLQEQSVKTENEQRRDRNLTFLLVLP